MKENQAASFFEDALMGSDQAREIFPSIPYTREFPANLRTTNEAFKATIDAVYRQTMEADNGLARSVLVEIPRGRMLGNVIYVETSGGYRILYETYRPNDRIGGPFVIDEQIGSLPATALTDQQASRPQGCKYLFVGSVGSSNYGHWLVDDLPKLKAFLVIRGEHPDAHIVIVMSEYSDAMNRVRTDSIDAYLAGLSNYSFLFVKTDAVLYFEHLFFCTPVSYHPILKSQQALNDIVARLMTSRPTGGLPMFVERAVARGRTLRNANFIRFRLEMLGFRSIDPGQMSFAEQRASFSQAPIVVGCMGAAMTNTVFCAPGTPVVYLAPEGWVETFYWDLAAARGHTYYACFGPADDPDIPAHMSGYTIAWPMLKQVLQQLGLN